MKDRCFYMRICLGSLETKTPVLNSHIKRMDFNPQWIIPKSIIRKSVCHHAGDNAYFDNRNYFIRERKTEKTVDPSVATGSMLCSNDYMVIQRGGKGNALGRVIFRFDNDYPFICMTLPVLERFRIKTELSRTDASVWRNLSNWRYSCWLTRTKGLSTE